MAEENIKVSSDLTSKLSSSEDINGEEKKKMPERTEYIAVGGEDEEKEVADENGKGNEDNEAECLQNTGANVPEELTEKDRLVLYEKGVRLKRKGNNKHALPCFLSCLQGLNERDHFPVLPECLHNIAEIYSQEEEYEAAIQFAQAEKLYYETALITVDNKPKTGAADSNIDSISAETQGSTAANSTDAQKAEEYEKLAHMCLKQQNPQLALDYCAKAVKLQQSCYGEQHPVTLKTLDLFTVIYAEMGKQQYKAALEKFSAAQEKEKEAEASKETTKEEDATSTEDVAQEKPCTKESHQTADTKMGDVKQEHEQGQTESTTEETSPTQQDTVKVTMTSSHALMLYFIITLLLAVMLTTALCYMTQTDPKTTYNYMITRIRFYYYYYFKRKGSNGHQYF